MAGRGGGHRAAVPEATDAATRWPLKRLKAGPVELEFDRIISTVEAEIEPVEPAREILVESTVSELEELVRVSPASAVLEGFARVEQDLRDRLRFAGDPKADERMGTMALARHARELGIITPETVKAIQGIAVLRNLAAHGQAQDLPPEKAMDYLALVDAVLFAIRGAGPQAPPYEP